MSKPPYRLNDVEIVKHRPPKNNVTPDRPYAHLVEQERAANGQIVDVATLFLTNRECPFRCLMCDLWKNTTDTSIPVGSIPQQIDFALSELPPAKHLKLYNSGNFFDAQAIARDDFTHIAQRAQAFDHVIVENHPRLCNRVCSQFREQLGNTTLEIALGLETIDPAVLPLLNKQMTLDDFARGVETLLAADIVVRTFILLKAPFQNETQGVEWAIRSIEYALGLGAGCCAVIPTRAGNGIMEKLQADGYFSQPTLSSLEIVMDEGLKLAEGRGRVFVDLWDLEQFAVCPLCVRSRRDRLSQMNLNQRILPQVSCSCRELIL
ncbi:radical SAM protein [Bremerella cremea]|uniref:Radical SAM protein n=2 Tax=Bremerella cremea TaxID=1031537 RepID=A0A368KX50_9BACT|nr:radical SAM protein [Bremerella cremea]